MSLGGMCVCACPCPRGEPAAVAPPGHHWNPTCTASANMLYILPRFGAYSGCLGSGDTTGATKTGGFRATQPGLHG
eukprot:4494392-Alexandrium_andersonii.AAC.1